MHGISKVRLFVHYLFFGTRKFFMPASAIGGMRVVALSINPLPTGKFCMLFCHLLLFADDKNFTCPLVITSKI